MRKELTQCELKNLVYFDEVEGVLIRTAKTGKSTVIGSKVGRIDKCGYLITQINNVEYRVHRLIYLYAYGHVPKGEIDHINGNKSDNRLCNLRDVSRLENQQNIRKPYLNNTSGYMGVCWSKKDKKWQASIGVDSKRHFLGLFDDPKVAYSFYLEAKRKLHSTCTI